MTVLVTGGAGFIGSHITEALLETDATDGEVLSSTDNISINELADHVVEEVDADVRPVHEPEKEADARHTHADVSKARDLSVFS